MNNHTEINAETLAFIEQFSKADTHQLALQSHKYPQVNMPFAMDQIAGRQMAQHKLPAYAARDGIRYPHHLSMEQCSSQQTARYKAEVVQQYGGKQERFADLTAGFGVDFSFMAAPFEACFYCEQQAYLCELAHHNFPLLGLAKARILNENGIQFLKEAEPLDWVYLDPARRDKNGGKVVAIADCEPDVQALEPLLVQKANRVMVKLSPMLDITLALRTLTSIQAIHVVSVHNECKELLLILGQNPIPNAQVALHCINFTAQGERQTYSFTGQEEEAATCAFAPQPLHYLYEPNTSIIKAGGYRSVAERHALQKLHPNSHLYTSDRLVPDFPGRIFEIESFGGFSKNELKPLLTNLTKANLTIRNFPGSVAELRKRLKLADGGETYLFATTLYDERKAMLRCHKAIIC